jgi:hypothetical protein
MHSRRFAAVTGALVFAAFAPPAIANPGVGTAPGDESPSASGAGFGPRPMQGRAARARWRYRLGAFFQTWLYTTTKPTTW